LLSERVWERDERCDQ